MVNGDIYAHPSIAQAMKRQMAESIEAKVERHILNAPPPAKLPAFIQVHS
jgi:hypothetical protein